MNKDEVVEMVYDETKGEEKVHHAMQCTVGEFVIFKALLEVILWNCVMAMTYEAVVDIAKPAELDGDGQAED